MAKRLHNTQIEECLKHYKHMDLLRHKQLFYMFINTRVRAKSFSISTLTSTTKGKLPVRRA